MSVLSASGTIPAEMNDLLNTPRVVLKRQHDFAGFLKECYVDQDFYFG